MQRVNVLLLTDVFTDMVDNQYGFAESKQYDCLDREKHNYIGISDNGREPDGNTYLIWGDAVVKDSPDVQAAINAGAEFYEGVLADYHAEFRDNTIQFTAEADYMWSAVGHQAVFIGKVHFNLNDEYDYHWEATQFAAKICQRTFDFMNEDNDTETIAARVMGE